MVNADDTTYIFESKDSSNNNITFADGTNIQYSKGNGSTKPAFYTGGMKFYAKNELIIKNENVLKNIELKISKTKTLKAEEDIKVNGASFSYDSATNIVTLTPIANEINIIFGEGKTSGNIQIESIKTSGGKVASYSNFNSLQLQYQYTFDVSNAKDVEEVGIYVTDDTTFDFDTTGAYDNEYTFNSVLSKGKHGHTFVNKDKLETYTVGINIPEINLDTTGTTFKACAYVKTNGKYYFAKNVKTLTIESMLEAYMNMTDLDQEAKNVVNAFYNYLLELTSK